jgi:hypothetical protein
MALLTSWNRVGCHVPLLIKKRDIGMLRIVNFGPNLPTNNSGVCNRFFSGVGMIAGMDEGRKYKEVSILW